MTVTELRKALKSKGNVVVLLDLVADEAPVEVRAVKSTLAAALKGLAGSSAVAARNDDGNIVVDASASLDG
jgi:hypothetical protein